MRPPRPVPLPLRGATTDTFVKGLESIEGYRDIFNGPEASFGADKHQGASSSFLAVVKGGRLGAPDGSAGVLARRVSGR
jgi:hypothetical protein